MSDGFKAGAETFRAEVSEWLETEGYESAARVVGAWPLPEEQPPGESREARRRRLMLALYEIAGELVADDNAEIVEGPRTA